jgi:prevent-host-death family protein
MVTIGVSEAEAQFASLLDQVERGEEVVIVREGKPVARLVAPAPAPVQSSELTGADLVERFREARKNARLDGLSWRELRDHGRR